MEKPWYETSKAWLLVIPIAIFIVFLWPHTDVWEGEGTVDAAPDPSSVKNYRLDASIQATKKRHGWFTSSVTYNVDSADWPNGGTMELDDCLVPKDGTAACADQDGTTYEIQVITAPEQPEADSPDF